MALIDTLPDDDEQRFKMVRKMTGEQRVRLAVEMSERYREIQRTRIRQEHPEWADWQIKRELFRLAFLPQPMPNIPDEFWIASETLARAENDKNRDANLNSENKNT